MTWLPDTAMAHPRLARLPPALFLPEASPRGGAKATGHGRPNSARPWGQVNASHSQPADGPPPLSHRLFLSKSIWPTSNALAGASCLPPRRHSKSVDGPISWPHAVLPRRLHRALPRWHFPHRHQGWHHGTCRYAPPANYTTQDTILC